MSAAVTTDPGAVAVPVLDLLPVSRAVPLLLPCCASRRWADAVLAGRPYGTLAALRSSSDSALGALAWSDVLEALAAHPRIGDRAGGADRESAWSRQEQAATASVAPSVAEQLRAGNVAYEQRFGHVFLICATGRSAPDMLAALQERLTHTPEQEQPAVRAELTAIVRLRLAKAFV